MQTPEDKKLGQNLRARKRVRPIFVVILCFLAACLFLILLSLLGTGYVMR